MSLEHKHVPYDLQSIHPRNAFYETYWKEVAFALLAKHADVEGMSILDYGCGRGEALGIYATAGMEPTGADLDPECVGIAGQFGSTVQLKSGSPLDTFAPKSFDVVSCFHVLEHVERPKEVLSELTSIAKSYLLLAVPNLQKLDHMHKRRIDPNLINEGHLQSWDHWHFLNLAQRHCGLELVEWGHDVTILPVISHWIGRLAGWKTAVRLEKGLFRKLLPNQCLSVIGLFKVAR